jgi:hypothetical protein
MDKSKRILLYGECYAMLMFALYKKNKGYEVTIITINANVNKFCEKVEMKSIYFKKQPISLRHVKNIRRYKRNIKNILKNLDVVSFEAFYFIDNAIALEAFYLVRLLKDKLPIYYYKTIEFNDIYNFKFTATWFYAELNILLYKIVLGVNLVLKDINNKPEIGIDAVFYEQNNVMKIQEELDFYQLKEYVIRNNKIDITSYDVMFADQGVLRGIVIKNELEPIFQMFQNENIDIVIKEHPNFKQEINVFGDIPKYPDYIPSEFLFNNINKYVISVYSETLVSASKQSHLKAISLLEIVDWENEDYKNQVKQNLINKSDNKIIFVDSIDELKIRINEK